MPLVFRMINSRVRWYKGLPPSWLETPDDCPADSLNDFRTHDNSLSTFIVDDDRSNLNRIVAALAGTRPDIDKLDYLLFDLQTLSTSSVRTKKSRGDTPDEKVNEWHVDIIEVSGFKLVRLISAIRAGQYQTGRFLPKEIRQLIEQGVNSGEINRERLQAKIREEIG
jgi:hypothetical protein